MPHPSPCVASTIRRWMSGLPLDQRERAIVDETLADNKAAQLLRCYEGAAS